MGGDVLLLNLVEHKGFTMPYSGGGPTGMNLPGVVETNTSLLQKLYDGFSPGMNVELFKDTFDVSMHGPDADAE